METVNGGGLGDDKGGPPPPSPLTGCYLLIVIGEPHSDEHRDIILQKVAKGLLSWNLNDCLVDLEKELAVITEQGLEGEEARYGERLIQFASENLVTEILIHPAVNTLSQCVRNLLSSFTRHRHIIHAGYTFQGNGSWALQDGTFSYVDFAEAFQEIEVQRVIRAYENGISVDLHCSPEGEWSRLPKEAFTKSCKVRVNPTDVLTTGSPSITSFVKYLSPFLVPTSLESILESSDVVGNIRFSRPTLYVFPGGQGDAALFGINGFNMLLDGGYSRKACFWDFVRHLDRLDAVLMSRLNNCSVRGISSVLKRKRDGAVYPQIGHFFCNIQERKSILSPDGDKDRDPLIISLLDEGQSIVSDLRHLNLTPQFCYRDTEPIILYHKVGHGTLNMYVLSPERNSKDVRDFLQKWNQSDAKLFSAARTGKEFVFPLPNLVSICALLIWQPANPNDTITRILYPGSTPQKKIFEGLDRLRGLEYIKHAVCSEKSLAPAKKTKHDVIEKMMIREKPQAEKKIEDGLKNGDMNGDVVKEKQVIKSDSIESEKSGRAKKPDEVNKVVENGDKAKSKPKVPENKTKQRSDSQQRRKPAVDKKGPPTPKKTVDNRVNGENKEKEKKLARRASPSATPAKSTKDANNRKVIEAKKAPPKKEVAAKAAAPPEPKPKVERKPISRRPKAAKAPLSPVKKLTNGVQKPDSLSKRGKLDKEGTTDSSTVSTPSADQESVLKKDLSKLTPEEIQQIKAQELAELKEEQEAIKEIEAVFRKGEEQIPSSDIDADLRQIKDISIEEKLETEEYLIIEKEELEHDSLEVKEDEMQKLTRDSEESEKQRKLSAEEQMVDAKPESVDEKEEEVKQVTGISSPEEKAVEKKEHEDEVKEVIESHPEEKVSANIESGATTTAPTLPEDERITLDEIKEDSGQVIEEKHVKEETKEKEIPVIQLPPKSYDNLSKLPQVVGIRLDKQSHIRDIVKTPDEVADLPVHEEVDFQEYTGEGKKTNDVGDVKKMTEHEKKDLEKIDSSKHVEKEETSDILEKADLETKEKEVAEPEVSKEVLDETMDDEWVVITKEAGKIEADEDIEQNDKDAKESEKETVDVKEVESLKEALKDEKIIEQITETELNKAEDLEIIETSAAKIEKSEEEHAKLNEDINDLPAPVVDTQAGQGGIDQIQEDTISTVKTHMDTTDKKKGTVEQKSSDTTGDAKVEEIVTKEKQTSEVDENKASSEIVKTIPSKVVDENKEVAIDKAVEQEPIISEDHHHIEAKQVVGKPQASQLPLEEETSDGDKKPDGSAVKEEMSKLDKESQEPKDIQGEVLEDKTLTTVSDTGKEKKQADTQEFKTTHEEVFEQKSGIEDTRLIESTPLGENKEDGSKLDQKLDANQEEVVLRNIEEDSKQVLSKAEDLKKESHELETIDAKLQELKIGADAKPELQIKTGTSLSPEHAEQVTLPDSSPEDDDLHILKELKDIDKAELGRKSPQEREEEVKKIVAGVAEVLKSPAPLEVFEANLPTFTQELRETHITTQDSPVLETKSMKTEDISSIPEEPTTLADELSDAKNKKRDLIAQSQELIAATSKVISDIREKTLEKGDSEEAGTVHRMLVTASSEDGGEETEICPPGTITFSRSSESSGRSSPEPSQKTSQKSSIVETLSETLSTVKQIVSEKDSGIDETKSEDRDVSRDVEESGGSPDLEAEQEKKTGIFGSLKDTFDSAKEFVKDTVESVVKATSDEAKKQTDDLKDIKDETVSKFEIAEEDVKAHIGGLKEAVGQTVDEFQYPLVEKTEAVKNETKDMLEEKAKDIKEVAEQIEHSVQDFEEKLKNGIAETDKNKEKVFEETEQQVLAKVSDVETKVESSVKELKEVNQLIEKVTEQNGGDVKHDIKDEFKEREEKLLKKAEQPVNVEQKVKEDTATVIKHVTDASVERLEEFEKTHSVETKEDESSNLKEELGRKQSLIEEKDEAKSQADSILKVATIIATPEVKKEEPAEKLEKEPLSEPVEPVEKESTIEVKHEPSHKSKDELSRKPSKENIMLDEKPQAIDTASVITIVPLSGKSGPEVKDQEAVKAEGNELLAIKDHEEKSQSVDKQNDITLLAKSSSGTSSPEAPERKQSLIEAKTDLVRSGKTSPETKEDVGKALEKEDHLAVAAKSFSPSSSGKSTPDSHVNDKEEKVIQARKESSTESKSSPDEPVEKKRDSIDQLKIAHEEDKREATKLGSPGSSGKTTPTTLEVDHQAGKIESEKIVKPAGKGAEVKESDEFVLPKEIVDKEEKVLEERAVHMQESFEAVSDLSRTISFDKCHKPDTAKQEKETIEKEKKVEGEKETVALDTSKATEKEEVLDIKGKEEIKELQDGFYESLEKPDKTKEEIIKDKLEHELEEAQRKKSVAELQNGFIESIAKDLEEDDYKIPKDEIEKEEKELEKRALHVQESFEAVSDLAGSISFSKCHPTDGVKIDKDVIQKEEKQIEEEVRHLEETLEVVSNLSGSVEFSKCHPIDGVKIGKDVIQKDGKEVEEKVKPLEETLVAVSDVSKSVDFEKCKATSDDSASEAEIKEIHQQQRRKSSAVSIEEIKKLQEGFYESLGHVKVGQIEEIDGNVKKSEPIEAEHVVSKDVIQNDEKELDKKVMHIEETEIEGRTEKPASEIIKEEIKDLQESFFESLLESGVEGAVKDNDVSVLQKGEFGKTADIRNEEKIEEELEQEKKESFIAETTDKPSVDDNKLSESKLTKDVILPDEKRDYEKPSPEKEELAVEDGADKPAADLKESAVAEKDEKESMEKVSTKSTLEIDRKSEPKKLSISDVEISIKTEICPKDASQMFIESERTTFTDSADAKVFQLPKGDDSSAGSSSKLEVCSLSGKSTPEVERSGKITPPTVPVSPVIRDTQHAGSRSPSKDTGLSEYTETDDDDLSTKSQVAHSQSDLDEMDMKMDPMSMSYYGALPDEESENPPGTYLYEITKAKYTKALDGSGTTIEERDIMTASFIGELPQDKKTEGSAKDAVDEWGKPLGLPAPSYLHDITKAKFSSQMDVMTSSFIGELPSGGTHGVMSGSVYFDGSSGSGDDPIADWGKPLGLPSPAPMNNNDKGTPKKEKKLPAHVTAKNKLNDDRKRAESPSKLRNKKANHVYVDLTYVPHHGNHYYSYVDFFRRIRARYYVFSGLEPSRQVYDALLEAKQTWDDKELEVTIIPTYDTDILGYWVAENEELLSKFKIDLSPSASRCTINLQDHETSCSAYRLEF
ncbi:microtubule-associated protein futsch [Cylas formicarius]|uniref:microtubule-associated protein futsch n=1 Tax=Cylas formicarius TaxID=197179 RepID=UPI002958BC1A|nr:microtubule-associated protein futsch [Cylas formicarius]